MIYVYGFFILIAIIGIMYWAVGQNSPPPAPPSPTAPPTDAGSGKPVDPAPTDKQ